jgi:DNA-binding Lrp family transcriptional regulator
MATDPPDRIDRMILAQLQGDARNVTVQEIADRVDLAGSTVADRINDLEDRGVVTGYDPRIDYDVAGFDQHLIVSGTARPDDREATVDAAIDIPGVVSVQELLTDEDNITVELVTRDQDETEHRVERLNDLGIEVTKIEVLKREIRRPFDDVDDF